MNTDLATDHRHTVFADHATDHIEVRLRPAATGSVAVCDSYGKVLGVVWPDGRITLTEDRDASPVYIPDAVKGIRVGQSADFSGTVVNG